MKQLAWVAAAAWLVTFGAASGAGIQGLCQRPASMTVVPRPMPQVAAALRPGGQLDVLALGSASLLGQHGGEEGSVPDRMVAALHARVPGATIHLTMRAGRADSAAEMLSTLKQEVAAHRYQLVLWQSGTVEALRHVPPGQFRQTLAEGIAAATAAGADVVLIDMQYSHLLDRHADVEPYRAAMSAAAAPPGVLLFSRYALMRAWAEDQQLDLEATAKPNRRRAVARLHECLGTALARTLMGAALPGNGS